MKGFGFVNFSEQEKLVRISDSDSEIVEGINERN